MGWLSQQENGDLSKPTLREGRKSRMEPPSQGGRQEQAGGAELLIQSKQYQQLEFIHFSLTSTFCHCSETEYPSPGFFCVCFYYSGSGSLFLCPARHRGGGGGGVVPTTPAQKAGTPAGLETRIFSPRAEEGVDVAVSLHTAKERVVKKRMLS